MADLNFGNLWLAHDVMNKTDTSFDEEMTKLSAESDYSPANN